MAIPVKLTRAHQVTLPKRLLERAGWLDQEFFLAELEGDHLVLKPLPEASHDLVASFEALKRHFARVGITRKDVRDAITWVRRENAAKSQQPGKVKRKKKLGPR